MIKKQSAIIIGIFAFVLILSVAYFVFQGALTEDAETPVRTEGPHGESIGPNDRVFIIDHISKETLKEVTVTNKYGTYRYYRGSDNELYFEGAEGMLYNSEQTASLIVNAGYLLAVREVLDYSEDLSLYGLVEGKYTAIIEIASTTDSVMHKIYIGDKIVTGGGYYAMLDGRDAVYVLDSDMETALLQDITTYFVPQVAVAISQNNYFYISNFLLKKSGEKIVEIQSTPTAGLTGTTASHKMIYPGDFIPSSENFDNILLSFCSFVGESVVEYNLSQLIGKEGTEFTELLLKYDIIDMTGKFYHEINYTYEGNKTVLYVSKLSEDNYYYLYSPGYDVIVSFPKEALPWLEWGLNEYVDDMISKQSIFDVASMQIITATSNDTYNLSGEVNKLSVIDAATGKSVHSVLDFQYLYREFIKFYKGGYAEYVDGTEPSLTVIITMENGDVKEYVFYDISSRKSYYTINGVGHFYVNRDHVRGFLENVVNFKNHDPINVGSYE